MKPFNLSYFISSCWNFGWLKWTISYDIYQNSLMKVNNPFSNRQLSILIKYFWIKKEASLASPYFTESFYFWHSFAQNKTDLVSVYYSFLIIFLVRKWTFNLVESSSKFEVVLVLSLTIQYSYHSSFYRI